METARRTIRLHRAQAEFRRSPALYRGFVGGRGAGKTWVGAYDLIRRAKRGRSYLVASPTSILMHDITFPTLKALALDLGAWGGVKLTPYPNVRLTTGAELRFRTADDPEKLRGPNLSGCWLDEASLMDVEAYNIAIACLREQGEQGWLSATFTPKGLSHWTYATFACGRSDTSLVQAKTRDNPFNPASFHQTLAQQYSGLRARQELDGEFVNVEGAEWPQEWFPPHIFFHEWPANLRLRVIALDPSKGNRDRPGDYSAFALVALDERGHLWVDVDAQQRRPIPVMVEDGLRLYQEFQPRGFCVETNQFQEMLGPEFLRRSRERGMFNLPMYGVDNYDPKVERIRTLGGFLARGELHVRDTVGGHLLVAQLRDFPEGEHDDAPDAVEQAVRLLRFLIEGGTGRGKPRPIAG